MAGFWASSLLSLPMNAILSAALSIGLISQLQPGQSDPAANLPAVSHWEGAITLPGTALGIMIDLEKREQVWHGSIDIPVQGLRGYALDDLTIEGNQARFSLPNIPGDPEFSGTIAPTGTSISGTFNQSGQAFPFKLTQMEKTAVKGATPSKGIPGEGVEGVWQGSIKVNAFELRLLFNIKRENDSWTGTMDSLDQNASGIPISEVQVEENVVTLKLKSIGGAFQGEVNEAGSEINGEWKQGGQGRPLKILRIEKAPDLSRPQDPKKPYPYNEEEVTFENEAAKIKLAGTLTFPKSGGPFPVAILVSGSGPQDRNESLMGHRPFLVLADHLTRNGIAVLRYDDRGVGKSEGRFSKALVKDFTSDALAAVRYLKGRPEFRGRPIGIVGHSEGGLVAPEAAVQSSDVDFIVLLAGVGVPLQELLERQSADMIRVMGADEETIAKQAAIQQTLFEKLRTDSDSKNLRPEILATIKTSIDELTPEQMKALGLSESQLEGQADMLLSPWFRDLMQIDPRPTLAQVNCPVLAINGEKDVQVAFRENLSAIEKALKEGGNSDVTTQSFPDLNHLFQTCETGAITEYALIEQTFHPSALEVVSEWIKEKTADH